MAQRRGGSGGGGSPHLNQGRSVVSARLVLQQLQELLLPQLKARPVVHRSARTERLPGVERGGGGMGTTEGIRDRDGGGTGDRGP